MTIRNIALTFAMLASVWSPASFSGTPIDGEQIKQLLNIQGGTTPLAPGTATCPGRSPCYQECTQQGMEEYLWKPINIKIAQADYGAAMAASELSASILSVCALKKMENDSFSLNTPNFTLPEWAAQIGSMLTFERISMQKRGLMETDKSRKTAERAMTFLVYAQQNGAYGADKSLAMLRKSMGAKH